MVMADLARELRIHIDMDWMAVSSYGAGTQSSGVVRILKDLDTDLTDRRVLIVEDIIDSGLTLSWLKENLSLRGAKSVEICALLRKPDAAKVDVEVKYLGFDIPNEFVVGYGLDYANTYRNLRGRRDPRPARLRNRLTHSRDSRSHSPYPRSHSRNSGVCLGNLCFAANPGPIRCIQPHPSHRLLNSERRRPVDWGYARSKHPAGSKRVRGNLLFTSLKEGEGPYGFDHHGY